MTCLPHTRTTQLLNEVCCLLNYLYVAITLLCWNKLCRRPPQYASAPASWQYIRIYSPGGICSGMWAFKTSATSWPLTFWPWKWCPSHVCYRCTSFSLPKPLSSRLRPDVRDRRQTDVRRHHRLMPPPYGGGGIIKILVTSDAQVTIRNMPATTQCLTCAQKLIRSRLSVAHETKTEKLQTRIEELGQRKARPRQPLVRPIWGPLACVISDCCRTNPWRGAFTIANSAEM